MAIPLDVFGDRRQQGSTSPMLDIKPENLMMAAAEMHRMGRFEALKAEHEAKVPNAIAGQRGRLRG